MSIWMFTIKFFHFFCMFETFYLKNVGGNAIRIFYGIWQAEYEIPLEGKKCKIDLKVLKQSYLEEFALSDIKIQFKAWIIKIMYY